MGSQAPRRRQPAKSELRASGNEAAVSGSVAVLPESVVVNEAESQAQPPAASNGVTFLVEEWPIDRVIPYARNARKIPESAIAKVAASIKEFGWQQPIVVDEQGVILAGHVRREASLKLGLQTVPVKIAIGLSEAKAKAFRLMDNRSHDDASWDYELASIELSELREDFDFNLELTGFDKEEIQTFLHTDWTPTAPAPVEKPVMASVKLTIPQHDLLKRASQRLGMKTEAEAIESMSRSILEKV